jgi:hypothetical protein
MLLRTALCAMALASPGPGSASVGPPPPLVAVLRELRLTAWAGALAAEDVASSAALRLLTAADAAELGLDAAGAARLWEWQRREATAPGCAADDVTPPPVEGWDAHGGWARGDTPGAQGGGCDAVFERVAAAELDAPGFEVNPRGQCCHPPLPSIVTGRISMWCTNRSTSTPGVRTAPLSESGIARVSTTTS